MEVETKGIPLSILLMKRRSFFQAIVTGILVGAGMSALPKPQSGIQYAGTVNGRYKVYVDQPHPSGLSVERFKIMMHQIKNAHLAKPNYFICHPDVAREFSQHFPKVSV